MNDTQLNENLSENMNKEEITKKVIEITASKLLKDGNASEIKSGSNFIEDLKADSLDIVELVMAFEEAFNCEIPDDVAEKIKTVQDAIDYIVENQK